MSKLHKVVGIEKRKNLRPKMIGGGFVNMAESDFKLTAEMMKKHSAAKKTIEFYEKHCQTEDSKTDV